MMNPKKELVDLSRAEFEILRALWKQSPATVREVHEQLLAPLGWAYTTTKTMMDRMVKKDLLGREEFHGIFLYRPLISRPAGLARMIQFFAERVLEMDAASVISMFAHGNTLSQPEIEELSRLLEQNKAVKE